MGSGRVMSYNQVPCTTHTTKMVTVVLPQGQYQLLKVGKSVCNSRRTWCRCSDEVLKYTPAYKWVSDLILQVPDVTGLVPDLRQALEASRDGGIVYSKKKLDYGTEIAFIGSQISDKVFSMEDWIISEVPQPKGWNRATIMLRQGNQFCHYHLDLSQTCKHPRELLKKVHDCRWEEIRENQIKS